LPAQTRQGALGQGSHLDAADEIVGLLQQAAEIVAPAAGGSGAGAVHEAVGVAGLAAALAGRPEYSNVDFRRGDPRGPQSRTQDRMPGRGGGDRARCLRGAPLRDAGHRGDGVQRPQPGEGRDQSCRRSADAHHAGNLGVAACAGGVVRPIQRIGARDRVAQAFRQGRELPIDAAPKDRARTPMMFAARLRERRVRLPHSLASNPGRNSPPAPDCSLGGPVALNRRWECENRMSSELRRVIRLNFHGRSGATRHMRDEKKNHVGQRFFDTASPGFSMRESLAGDNNAPRCERQPTAHAHCI
jgi:hypothetical protein